MSDSSLDPPASLRDLDHWVVWKLEYLPDRSKPAKVPYNPATGRRAHTNDPRTWQSFDRALKVYKGGRYHGIGIVLAPPIVGRAHRAFPCKWSDYAAAIVIV